MNTDETVVERLDALIGLALAQGGDDRMSLEESCRYLRNLDFSNQEISRILGKSLHHIEVIAAKLVGQGKIAKQKGRRDARR
jgi:hypothetical protein